MPPPNSLPRGRLDPAAGRGSQAASRFNSAGTAVLHCLWQQRSRSWVWLRVSCVPGAHKDTHTHTQTHVSGAKVTIQQIKVPVLGQLASWRRLTAMRFHSLRCVCATRLPYYKCLFVFERQKTRTTSITRGKRLVGSGDVLHLLADWATVRL